jgi:hypothetical protein
MSLTLTIQQLSEQTNLKVKTIRSTLVRNPQALPPRLLIPGQRKLLWLATDVEDFYRAQKRAHGSSPSQPSIKVVEQSIQAIDIHAKKRGRPTKVELLLKQTLEANK